MQEELITFLRNQKVELIQEKHPKGAFLVAPHEHCPFIFLIDKGAVKVTEWIDEKEQIIRFGYKGNWLTALDSFLNDKPTRFAIETLKSTCVRRINLSSIIKIGFRPLRNNDHEVAPKVVTNNAFEDLPTVLLRGIGINQKCFVK